MTWLDEFAAECLRLYRSTPSRVPSVEWVQLLLRNASDLLTGIQDYSAHLAGKPYKETIIGDRSEMGSCGAFVFSVGSLNQAAARLECQLNPKRRPRADRKFTETLKVSDVWGRHQIDLQNSMGWLRKYLLQVQDAMGWAEQAEGSQVSQQEGTSPGTRQVYDEAKCIVYYFDAESFVWPMIPEAVATGIQHIVERLERIAGVAEKTDLIDENSLLERFSPSALGGTLDLGARTIGTWAKKLGIATPSVGGKDFTYSYEDVIRICRKLAAEHGNEKVRLRAEEFLHKLTKTAI